MPSCEWHNEEYLWLMQVHPVMYWRGLVGIEDHQSKKHVLEVDLTVKA